MGLAQWLADEYILIFWFATQRLSQANRVLTNDLVNSTSISSSGAEARLTDHR
jgi:hypothetical protein